MIQFLLCGLYGDIILFAKKKIHRWEWNGPLREKCLPLVPFHTTALASVLEWMRAFQTPAQLSVC